MKSLVASREDRTIRIATLDKITAREIVSWAAGQRWLQAMDSRVERYVVIEVSPCLEIGECEDIVRKITSKWGKNLPLEFKE